MRQVHRQLILPAEMDQTLTQIAQENGTTSSQVVRKALALYMVAVEKKREDIKLGFVNQDGHLGVEVIGL